MIYVYVTAAFGAFVWGLYMFLMHMSKSPKFMLSVAIAILVGASSMTIHAIAEALQRAGY